MTSPRSALEPIHGAAVVTGSSGGIGRAIARRLARGASVEHVVLHYAENLAGAKETAALIQRASDSSDVRLSIVQADLAVADDVRRLADQAFQIASPVHTWVNNAGVDVLTGAAAQWDYQAKLRALLDVDVIGTFELSRIVGERLAQWRRDAAGHFPPSMIFVGWDQAATDAGMEGDAGMMFSPVKAAVMAFANGLAQTLAPDVRVNTIAPGWIQTAWGQNTSGYWDQRARGQSLMNRWGTPEDVAMAAAYLADPNNSFVTGQTIDINGGFNRRFQARDS